MEIIDAQIHLWEQGLPGNMAHRHVTRFSTEYVLGMMDEAGVDAALIHPPGWDPNSTQIATDAVQNYPGRFAILGAFPLDDPASHGLVDGWLQQPGMLGLRFTFLSPHQRNWMTDGTADWVWPAAEKAGIPIALLVTDHLVKLGEIAERHPGLKLIVDHLGGRGGNELKKDDAALEHMPQLVALAKYPNVAVKATGAPGYSSEGYPFRPVQPYLKQIYDAFGPDRMFWGTDISRMPCSWGKCISLFMEELPWLPDADKPKIMGQSLCTWIGWKR